VNLSILDKKRIGLLKKIIEFTQEKYPMFNIYVGLQGLFILKTQMRI